STVVNAPATGRTVAIRSLREIEYVFVAGAIGVKAGRINADGHWIPSDAPDAQYASVYGSPRSADAVLFLTSRQQREILVGTPNESDWLQLVLPSQNTEVAT